MFAEDSKNLAGESYSGKLLWPESTYLLIFFVLFPLANGS